MKEGRDGIQIPCPNAARSSIGFLPVLSLRELKKNEPRWDRVDFQKRHTKEHSDVVPGEHDSRVERRSVQCGREVGQDRDSE